MGSACSASKARNVGQPQRFSTSRQRLSGRGWGLDGCEFATQDFSTFADDDEFSPAPKADTPKVAPAAAADRKPALSISTRVEYAAIPSNSTQDVFGIITVEADAPPEPQDTSKGRQPLDIVSVLDVSGSMSGEKIELVQKAVIFLVKESQPQDRISIVAFNHAASRVLKLCGMTKAGKKQATDAVRSMQAGGGTNIPSGVEVALEVVERRRHRNPVTAILLLTDGQDGSSGETWAPLIQRAQAAGCSLYAFGFGADHDARLLTEVAELAQTPFTYVEDVDQIGAAFAGAIGGLVSVAAQRVEVSLDCNVQLKAAHTPFPTSQDGSRTVVRIPDILAGERRDILVELSVPARSGDESSDLLLLKASAKYWDLFAETDAQCDSAEMHLSRMAEEEPQPEPDEEVSRQRDRWEVTVVLKEAAAHGEARQFEEAQALLSSHQAKLRNGRKSAVSEALAMELQDAADRLQSDDTWNDGGWADLGDKRQMHLMQRATNMSVAKKSRGTAQSKALYVTSVQQSWISKAK